MMEAYHRIREPLYREIITDAGLARDSLVLDAGCGDAFYSRLLADALGPAARIVAVDLNSALLPSHAERNGSISFCLSDVERAGLRPRAFDAVWLCRAMHSALDPLRRIGALAALLRPGGKLIAIENDFAHYPSLSVPADFEHRVRAAHHQYLKSRHDDGSWLERYHAARHLPRWLERAGLSRISIRRYVATDVAPMGEDVEAYWRLFLAWLRGRVWPFLSSEDREAYSRAFDSASPDYLLRQPGFSCRDLTTVVRGVMEWGD